MSLPSFSLLAPSAARCLLPLPPLMLLMLQPATLPKVADLTASEQRHAVEPPCSAWANPPTGTSHTDDSLLWSASVQRLLLQSCCPEHC
jgi:hypothetical protein